MAYRLLLSKKRTQRANTALLHEPSETALTQAQTLMKYELVENDRGVEAISAYSGYRIRMSLGLSAAGPQARVWVRGSESEAEVEVDVPLRPSGNRDEAFGHGYAHAVMWIDAENKRIP